MIAMPWWVLVLLLYLAVNAGVLAGAADSQLQQNSQWPGNTGIRPWKLIGGLGLVLLGGIWFVAATLWHRFGLRRWRHA